MINRGIGSRSELALHDEIVRRIVAVADPDMVVVFGTRARGDDRPGSDVDVLVVQESSEPRYKRAGTLYVALADLPVEVDVVVYTPREILEWGGVEQAFVTTAVREGVVVYERPARPRAGLAAQGRE
jgi:predicted nucleotidyltransferase